MTSHLPAEHERSTGARPAGVDSEQAAAVSVQHMFDEIAPTYDRANHLLSFGLDRLWWKRAARSFRPVLSRPDARILDLCCGTGDMTAALLAHRPAASASIPVTGADFSPEMLARARVKHAGRNVLFHQEDALSLSVPDRSFDLVTFAFGFRNLANYADGLREVFRVLRPGGQIGILECNQPGGLTGALYSIYFKHVLPTLGGIISGKPSAYRYLPASVERFPRPLRMLALLQSAGFRDVAWDSYTFSTAGLYRGTRP
jgi:demethylmenaquinone methyltransferase/2-methoxy-6-polyprenyl-1,4-benzoquinol methylase